MTMIVREMKYAMKEVVKMLAALKNVVLMLLALSSIMRQSANASVQSTKGIPQEFLADPVSMFENARHVT